MNAPVQQPKQPQLSEVLKKAIRWRAQWAYEADGDQHNPYRVGTPEAKQFRQYIRELQDNDR